MVNMPSAFVTSLSAQVRFDIATWVYAGFYHGLSDGNASASAAKSGGVW